MATKQKQNQTQAKKSEIESTDKCVVVDLLKDMNVIEFKVWLNCESEWGEDKTFGGGAFKREDLKRVIAELTDFAGYLEICDAEERGYQRAIQERKKKTKSDDENEQQHNTHDEDEQDDDE